MTQSETVLISLIKKALFGIEESLPSDVDWDAVYQEAQAQAVFGLVAPLVPNPTIALPKRRQNGRPQSIGGSHKWHGIGTPMMSSTNS